MTHPDDNTNTKSSAVWLCLLLRICDGEDEKDQQEGEKQLHSKALLHSYSSAQRVHAQWFSSVCGRTCVGEGGTNNS